MIELFLLLVLALLLFALTLVLLIAFPRLRACWWALIVGVDLKPELEVGSVLIVMEFETESVSEVVFIKVELCFLYGAEVAEEHSEPPPS